MPDNQIDVLDHGFVRLDAYMADDLSVANAARVSFARRHDFLDQSDLGLINMLMRDHHGTPFEHNAFRFHVRCPLFVAREWFRHRIGSFNEFSMRYAKASDEFYVPAAEDVRTQIGKPGAYTFESMDDEMSEEVRSRLQEHYDASYELYYDLVNEKQVAREIARVVLPMGAYTEFYWTVNARSLMHFLALRNTPEAQREIMRFATAVESLFSDVMPATYRSWQENGRIAP